MLGSVQRAGSSAHTQPRGGGIQAFTQARVLPPAALYLHQASQCSVGAEHHQVKVQRLQQRHFKAQHHRGIPQLQLLAQAVCRNVRLLHLRGRHGHQASGDEANMRQLSWWPPP
jgi:hypothetical protein